MFFYEIESSSTKIRQSTKMKSDSDSKSSNTTNSKKKEPITSPPKINAIASTKKTTNAPVVKPIQKLPIKTEPAPISNKSPNSLPVKQETSPNSSSSNSTSTTVLISSLKKIPKKVVQPPPPPQNNEKHARSPMSPLTSRNSDRVRFSRGSKTFHCSFLTFVSRFLTAIHRHLRKVKKTSKQTGRPPAAVVSRHQQTILTVVQERVLVVLNRENIAQAV